MASLSPVPWHLGRPGGSVQARVGCMATVKGVQCGLCPRVERSGRRPKRYVIEARRVETGRLHGLARCAARKHGPKRSAGERPVPGSAERRQSWKPGIRALAKAV